MKEKGESGGIRGLGVIGVIANYSIAHVAPDTGVRRLVAAVNSLDEDTSMAAYTALVKLGSGTAERVMREMKRGEETEGLIRLLGDLGDPGVIAYLEGFTDSDDPALASAAKESLDLLRLEDP